MEFELLYTNPINKGKDILLVFNKIDLVGWVFLRNTLKCERSKLIRKTSSGCIARLLKVAGVIMSMVG